MTVTLREVEKLAEQLSPADQALLILSLQQKQVAAGAAYLNSVEAKIAALEAALDAFREGLSDSDMQQIGDDMNAEYSDPTDASLFDWTQNASGTE